MANPPKAKGTRGENIAVDILVAAGFERGDPEDPNSTGVQRFRGDHASHDIKGVGVWVVEAKFWKRWHLFKWIRVIRAKAGTGPWAIVAIHGDRRTQEGREVGAVMVFDAAQGAAMMHHWETVPRAGQAA